MVGNCWPDVVRHLRCPVCRAGLAVMAPGTGPAALRCPAGHSFDVARHGYVDLTAGRVTAPGDTAEMVAARTAVLASGSFDFVVEAVRAAVARHVPAGEPAYPRHLAVEVGAGTGFHLAALLDARPDLDGLAFDVSKPALRRAARAHPRLATARADTWRGLPVADGTVAVLLDLFAPRAPAEFFRVLRPDGALVVVTPAPDHLRELVDALGLLSVDPAKEHRLAASLGARFAAVERTEHRCALELSHADAGRLVAMGPNAWHGGDPDRPAAGWRARLAGLPEPFGVTASVRVSVWRRAASVGAGSERTDQPIDGPRTLR